MKKEVRIYDKVEMKDIVDKSKKFLELLPDDPLESLVILTFLTMHIEKTTGLKIEGARVEMDE